MHKSAPGAQGIPPAFEWAQTPDSLLLNLKFAHKIDTPATLGCEVAPGDVTLSATDVRLRADCREKRKAFDLQLSLHAEASGGRRGPVGMPLDWSPRGLASFCRSTRKPARGA